MATTKKRKIKSDLGDLAVRLVGPKVVISFIKRANGGHDGRDVGRFIDRQLDQQFRNKKSGQVEKYMIPYIDDFYEALIEELRKGCKRDRRSR